MKILITSGGTKVPIDMVRDITNMSSGNFGTKITETLLRRGHQINFIRAKDSKSPIRYIYEIQSSAPPTYSLNNFLNWLEERRPWYSRYHESEYRTFEQYERTLQIEIGDFQPDVIVLAAAVSDYTVENPFQGKVRSNDLLTIKLTPLPKIINKVKAWAPNAKLVGFKLLVNSSHADLVKAAQKSIDENGCDLVVANDLDDIKQGKHKITLVFKNNIQVYDSDPTDPDFLAKVLASTIEQL